ncbi:MAG: hypothetical protein OEY49_12305 [Candidatus Heimdallarchaeota archaeon]|nr:hypothetical protein [Candidatus Heimdallarchaeota archaeon]
MFNPGVNNSMLEYYLWLNNQWISIGQTKTNVNGYSSRSYNNTNPLNNQYLTAGNYQFKVFFNSTPLYQSSEIVGTLHIDLLPVKLNLKFGYIHYNDFTAPVTVELLDMYDRPIQFADLSLIFAVYSNLGIALGQTDASGSIIHTLHLTQGTNSSDPHILPGDYNISLFFSGIAGKYESLATNQTLTILPDIIDLTYQLDIDGETVVFTVKNDDGAAIPNMNIDFSVQLQNWITQLELGAIDEYVMDYLNTRIFNQMGIGTSSFVYNSAQCSLSYYVPTCLDVENFIGIANSAVEQNYANLLGVSVDDLRNDVFGITNDIPSIITEINSYFDTRLELNSAFGGIGSFILWILGMDDIYDLFSQSQITDLNNRKSKFISTFIDDLSSLNGLVHLYQSTEISGAEWYAYQSGGFINNKWYSYQNNWQLKFLDWDTNYGRAAYPTLSDAARFDYYFSNKWKQGIMEYYDRILYHYNDIINNNWGYRNILGLRTMNRSNFTTYVIDTSANIKNIVTSLYNAKVEKASVDLSGAFIEGTTNALVDGFSFLISYGITRQDLNLVTNQDGQVLIHMDEYVFNQLSNYLNDTKIRFPAGNYYDNELNYVSDINLVVDYFDYITTSTPFSLEGYIKEVTNWFRSFNEFVFFFNITNSNYIGYVDAQFGYQTFEVSGRSARRYINPTYVDINQFHWDMEKAFFIPVPKEAIQSFGINIPEVFANVDLTSDSFFMNGHLKADDNGNKLISLYRKVGQNYVLVEETTTTGATQTIDISTLSFVDIVSTLIPMRASLVYYRLNPFRQVDGIYDQFSESMDDVTINSQTSTVTWNQPIINDWSQKSTFSRGGAPSIFGGVGDYAYAPPISTDSHTPVEGNFHFDINPSQLGVGVHEFMYKYIFEIPGTGNSIIIRNYTRVVVTSDVHINATVSPSGDGRYKITVTAIDDLGRPVKDLTVKLNVYQSILDGTTNSMGISEIYWTPPFIANFDASVMVYSNNEYYRTPDSKSFTIQDTTLGAFASLIGNSTDLITSAFEQMTGLTISEDVANGLQGIMSGALNSAALLGIQPLHLLTGNLNKWILPNTNILNNATYPFNIAEIGLRYDSIPLLDLLGILFPNINVNPFGILEDRWLDISFSLPFIDVLREIFKYIPFIDLGNDGSFNVDFFGIRFSLKLPSFSIPLPFRTPSGDFAKLRYADGQISIDRFENPLYTAIKYASNIKSLTDDGYFHIEIPDPLDLLDGRKDGKVTLSTTICWPVFRDWKWTEDCAELSQSFTSPLSFVSPGVMARFDIPDPLELLWPGDFTLNGRLDLIQIPNPNLFGRAIQLIQPDFQVEYGGGFPTDDLFISVFDLFSDLSETKLNLKIPYLAVTVTKLWNIQWDGTMIGVGENEGITTTVLGYVFNLFSNLLNAITGILDVLVRDLIYQPLRDLLFSALESSLDSYKSQVKSMIDDFKGSNSFVVFKSLANSFSVASNILNNIPLITNEIGNNVGSVISTITNNIPFDALSGIATIIEPIAKILDILGPIKKLVEFAIGGIAKIITQILTELLSELIESVKDLIFSAIQLNLESIFTNEIGTIIDEISDIMIEDDTYLNAEELMDNVNPNNLESSQDMSPLSQIFNSIGSIDYSSSIASKLTRISLLLDTLHSKVIDTLFNDTDILADILTPIFAPLLSITNLLGITSTQNDGISLDSNTPNSISIDFDTGKVISILMIEIEKIVIAMIDADISFKEEKNDDKHGTDREVNLRSIIDTKFSELQLQEDEKQALIDFMDDFVGSEETVTSIWIKLLLNDLAFMSKSYLNYTTNVEYQYADLIEPVIDTITGLFAQYIIIDMKYTEYKSTHYVGYNRKIAGNWIIDESYGEILIPNSLIMEKILTEYQNTYNSRTYVKYLVKKNNKFVNSNWFNSYRDENKLLKFRYFAVNFIKQLTLLVIGMSILTIQLLAKTHFDPLMNENLSLITNFPNIIVSWIYLLNPIRELEGASILEGIQNFLNNFMLTFDIIKYFAEILFFIGYAISTMMLKGTNIFQYSLVSRAALIGYKTILEPILIYGYTAIIKIIFVIIEIIIRGFGQIPIIKDLMILVLDKVEHNIITVTDRFIGINSFLDSKPELINDIENNNGNGAIDFLENLIFSCERGILYLTLPEIIIDFVKLISI